MFNNKLKVELNKLKAELKIVKAENVVLKTISEDNVGFYIDGSAQTWKIVKVIIYNMYKNLEILDYQSLIDAIHKYLVNYTSNEEIYKQKVEEFEQLAKDNDVKNDN
jgi:hypothetical protein